MARIETLHLSVDDLSDEEILDNIDFIQKNLLSMFVARKEELEFGGHNRYEVVKIGNECDRGRIKEIGRALREECKEKFGDNGILELHFGEQGVDGDECGNGDECGDVNRCNCNCSCSCSDRRFFWTYSWRDEVRAKEEIGVLDEMIQQYERDIRILEEELQRRSNLNHKEEIKGD